MVEPQDYTIQDYIAAKQAVDQAKISLEAARTNEDIATKALNQAVEGGMPQEDLQLLQNEQLRISASADLAVVASKKAIKATQNQATRENLEGLLGNFDSVDALKGFVSTYTPSFDREGNYTGNPVFEDAAQLHGAVANLKELVNYVRKGDRNDNTDSQLDQIAIQLTEDDIRENPKNYTSVSPDDEDFNVYVNAAMKLTYASGDVRKASFQKLAPGAINKTEADMYEIIGEGEEPLRDYISGSIADADIERALDGYANAVINASRNA
jgi:hypothetical protein